MNWSKCECGMNLPPGRLCPLCDENEKRKFRKVGVVIDHYKREAFEDGLRKNNFLYEIHLDSIRSYVILVFTNNAPKLQKLVKKLDYAFKKGI